MELTTTENSKTVVTLHVKGKLDGSNYQELLDEAQKLYTAGWRNLVMDLSELAFISSAGISALHRVALLFRGEKLADAEEGWAAYRAIDRERGSGVQKHVKLCKPTDKVLQSLEMVGFAAFFEIHTDLGQAVASFG